MVSHRAPLTVVLIAIFSVLVLVVPTGMIVRGGDSVLAPLSTAPSDRAPVLSTVPSRPRATHEPTPQLVRKTPVPKVTPLTFQTPYPVRKTPVPTVATATIAVPTATPEMQNPDLPADDDVDIQATQPPPGYNDLASITVVPYLCTDPTFDPELGDSTLAELEANCGDNLPNYLFRYFQDEPYSGDSTGTRGEPIMFDLFPNREAKVQQRTFPGIEMSFVYCLSNQEAEGWFQDVESSYSGVIDHIVLTPQPGENFWCEFYFRALSPMGDITVHVLNCPDGYALEGAGANLVQDCTEAAEGFEVWVNPINVAGVGFHELLGTDGPGTAVFEHMSSYKYWILLPTSIDEAMDWALTCHESQFEYNTYPSVVQLHLGASMECTFYLVPADG